ncbi:MAG: glycoside-pentoside-hexuronide (GPH):cation symporter [Lachnospiraceae bacterium]|nr:glycoside-pentoside-hexuronide (GPH):cation symporter [Lachnospiraceae bacterium]
MKLSVREKTAYGIGAIGKDMVYAFVSGFLMYYYNTVLGISATFIGILFMAARVFDAFNDPFMGVVVEKTHTKMGKFRPWLLCGTFTNAVVLFGMFHVPASFHGKTLLVYASIAYLLWGVTYTIMDIPYWSMIPAITDNGKDRENISVIARSCAGLGFAIPTALTIALVPILGGGDDRKGFSVFAIIISVFFVIALTITVCNVKEKCTYRGVTITIRQMLKALLQNDQALVVVLTIIIFNTSLYLTQNLAIYFFKYDIGNASLFGVFGTIGGAAQILSMMLLPVFRKKYDRIVIFKGAVITAMIGYLYLFLLGTFNITNIVLLCLAAVIIFLGFGMVTVLTTVFLADTVDYGEYKSNSRNEGVIFSLQTFVVKLASAVAVFIAGIGLDVIGLDITLEKQQMGTILGMRFMMTIIPIIGLIVCMIIFRKKYRLSELYLEQITQETKKRK